MTNDEVRVNTIAALILTAMIVVPPALATWLDSGYWLWLWLWFVFIMS